MRTSAQCSIELRNKQRRDEGKEAVLKDLKQIAEDARTRRRTPCGNFRRNPLSWAPTR